MPIIDSRYIQHLFGLSRIAYKIWRRRLLFLIGGILVGAVAVGMAFLADVTQAYFWHMLSLWAYAPFVATPAWLRPLRISCAQFFPRIAGQRHSASDCCHASQRSGRAPASRLLTRRLRQDPRHGLGFLCGASIGREGPTVQVGAAIMGAFSWLSPLSSEWASARWIGGGIAAAFNTPLAGIVFGIEEMSRSFESKTNGLVLGAVIAAGLTSLAIVGDYTYFGSTPAVLPLGPAWAVVPVCGIAGGFSGGLYSRILILFGNGLPGAIGAWIWRHPIVFAILCGIGVAICGFFSGGAVHGTGYEQARAIVHGENTQAFSYGFWKFLATVFSAISGIPGGIFAPSLSIGAGIGVDLSTLFHNVPIGALALLGMVAYLSGVVQAPMTSFVIVAEMTEDHAMIIPLMVAAVIATACSKLIYNDGLYHALAKNFVRAVGAKPEELAEVEE